MSEQFDPNKAIAETVTSIIENNFSKIWESGKSAVKSRLNDVKVFTSTHKRYITKVARDYYKAKSFLIQQTKTPLYNFYVPLGIERGETKYPEATIDNLTLSENFNVIIGVGGSGKSMMMRHLFLDTLRLGQKLPVFVELRDLNDSDATLYELIKETLYLNRFTRDDEFFEKALIAGHFAIFLDGFDEIDDRKKVAKEINKLAKDYDENIITISSRPDDSFSTWHLFNVWKTQPLTLEKACELVEKVPQHIFDKKIKDKFLKDLKDNLFATHNSFLSNPLLLSIMVLTYKDSADIPQKLSVFYDQAYTTLFQRHDALKGGYKRKRYCNLDIQDFSKVFSAFSILSFDKKKYSFTETEVLDLLEKAKSITNIDFDEQNFLEDAIQAVSLLIRDGLTITFAHRSFQEYFTALYIQQLSDKVKKILIDKYKFGYFNDNVTLLLYNIEPELIEKYLLIPEIEKLEELIEYRKGNLKNSLIKLLRTCFKSFYFFNDDTFAVFNPIRLNNYLDLMRLIIGINSMPYISTRSESVQKFVKSTISQLQLDESTFENHRKSIIPLEFIIKNDYLLNLLAEGDHWYSIKAMKAMIDYKDQLILKHKELTNSIEQELLLNSSN